jgi:ribonuclease VapC
MIVVDTSALMAIVLGEPEGSACSEALKRGGELVISAATVSEALIVAARRGSSEALHVLLEGLDLDVSPVLEADAHRAAQAYSRWGKGFHPAALNFGDCFAYALAKERGCPLLYVGDDFSQTDVPGVDFGKALRE